MRMVVCVRACVRACMLVCVRICMFVGLLCAQVLVAYDEHPDGRMQRDEFATLVKDGMRGGGGRLAVSVLQ